MQITSGHIKMITKVTLKCALHTCSFYFLAFFWGFNLPEIHDQNTYFYKTTVELESRNIKSKYIPKVFLWRAIMTWYHFPPSGEIFYNSPPLDKWESFSAPVINIFIKMVIDADASMFSARTAFLPNSLYNWRDVC